MIFTLSLIAAALTTSAPLPDATVPAAKPTASSSYHVRYDAQRDRYCLKARSAASQTGTRIPTEECRTKSEWAAQGLTIDHRP
jgi:hypothetical protein